MKYTILILAILLSGCGATNPTKSEKESLATQNANQHMAIGVTLAIFYCKQSRWPEGTEELREYSQSQKLPLPVQPDWNWLSRPNVEFLFGEQVSLKTPKGEAEDDIAVSSFNKQPKCDGGNIKVDIAINLGE